jgi:hypothetical protein
MIPCSEVDGYHLVVEIRCLHFQVRLLTRLRGSVTYTTVVYNPLFSELRDASGCIVVHLGIFWSHSPLFASLVTIFG